MFNALAAFEQSPLAQQIGWEVLVNPDEEIGSPGSFDLLIAAAKRNHLGLLFEPALPDGGLAARRKGAGNFSIVIHGKSAHTGRDFSAGRSAILAASELTLALHALNETIPGIIVNVGSIDGGGPPNVVPDLAICRVNVRTQDPQDESRLRDVLNQCVQKTNQRPGISAQLHGSFHAAPKIPDAPAQTLLDATIACAREIGLTLTTHSVGGSCDGNKLAAAGLPNVDTLGVRGGKTHSPEEFMIPASLTERTQLTTLLLLNLASGDIPWPIK
jgi:glutamate carboxypeptidase